MEPFVGEIRVFSFSVIPQGWLPCQGQLLPIPQYNALFSLLGIQFGGDGRTNFALPDLRGRVALGAANNGGPIPAGVSARNQGAAAGAEGVNLPGAALAEHSHRVFVSSANGEENATPSGKFPAASVSRLSPTSPLAPFKPVYVASSTTNRVSLIAQTVAPTPAQVPLANLQPSLCMQFCIATTGIYPPRP